MKSSGSANQGKSQREIGEEGEGGEARTDESNTGVSEDVLLVRRLDILVVERLSGLRVDPSNVEGAVLEATVEVLDETGDVGELERSLNRERASGLHLPTSTRGSERSHLGVSRHDDDLVEVDNAAKLRKLRRRVESLELGEGEGEVGARSDLDLKVDLLGVGSARGLKVERVVDRDGATGRSGDVEVGANLGRNGGEVGELVHSSIELREGGHVSA